MSKQTGADDVRDIIERAMREAPNDAERSDIGAAIMAAIMVSLRCELRREKPWRNAHRWRQIAKLSMDLWVACWQRIWHGGEAMAFADHTSALTLLVLQLSAELVAQRAEDEAEWARATAAESTDAVARALRREGSEG